MILKLYINFDLIGLFIIYSLHYSVIKQYTQLGLQRFYAFVSRCARSCEKLFLVVPFAYITLQILSYFSANSLLCASNLETCNVTIVSITLRNSYLPEATRLRNDASANFLHNY